MRASAPEQTLESAAKAPTHLLKSQAFHQYFNGLNEVFLRPYSIDFTSFTPTIGSRFKPKPKNRGFHQMEYRNQQGGVIVGRDRVAVGVDEGLRQYMLKVYNWMALGLALTGAVAFAVISFEP